MINRSVWGNGEEIGEYMNTIKAILLFILLLVLIGFYGQVVFIIDNPNLSDSLNGAYFVLFIFWCAMQWDELSHD